MACSAIPLRPHHGMCICFFTGKGYSKEFTENMYKVIEALRSGASVRLTCCADAVCAACPENAEGVCRAEEKASAYDRGVLCACGLKEGDALPYAAFHLAVTERVLKAGKRESICGGCEWNSICAEAEKLVR